MNSTNMQIMRNNNHKLPLLIITAENILAQALSLSHSELTRHTLALTHTGMCNNMPMIRATGAHWERAALQKDPCGRPLLTSPCHSHNTH